MNPEAQPEHVDAIALARLFVSGRSLKRGDTIQLVRDLLALLDVADDIPPGTWKEETVPNDGFKVICDSVPVEGTPIGIPNVVGYDAKPPVTITNGPSGAVFLGPEANRYYTRAQAIALAGAIARAAAKV